MKTLQPLRQEAPTFSNKIRQEFVQGSAISPSLFDAAVSIHQDIEVGPGGDVESPVHDALNWRFVRFGHQVRDSLEAALFTNEDGSPWQAKLDRKAKDYQVPKGNGSRAYLPPVNRGIRRAIAKRYGLETPPPGESFWNWVEYHPEIKIIFTEGGKKCLSLLSHDFVAIAVYGINCGYRVKDTLGNPIAPALIPDLQRFANPGREIVLAFDQDSKAETRRKVNRAISRFGKLLAKQGCAVKVATWDSRDGKGVDDLIANRGAQAWDRAYGGALPLGHWELQKNLERQLTLKPSLRLNSHDLSALEIENLPESGIIAIASAKGSGKTKFIGSLVSDSKKVLLGGHRICLMRNLCQGLGLGYRGDLDKARGQFISGCGYTLRVGTCLDSLLAFNPERFEGCDLILDEATQVLRHLLTSGTCDKGGKRPALLARFRELVKVARRVLLADADLDDASLNYIRELRGENAQVFLIKNDYKSQGYPVKFIEADDASAITAQLLEAVASKQPEQAILVQTDSKAASKTLAKLVQDANPGHRVLTINSDTSGGEIEKGFIENPDAALKEGSYDVVVASPSLATGVSIESQATISKVFGVFYGVSSTDSDMAQALARVREPVERIVWCAKRGRNFSQVGRSSSPLVLKAALKTRTDTEIALIRSNLREDQIDTFAAYDWKGDSHLNLWARIEAERNRSMWNLRDALLVRLRHEGNQVEVHNLESDKGTKQLLKDARQEIKEQEANAISAARELTWGEVEQLTKQEALSPEEQQAISRYFLQDFYLQDVAPELVLWDNSGRLRAQLLGLEAQTYGGTAVGRDLAQLDKHLSWGKGIVAWDVGDSEVKRKARQLLGLEWFLGTQEEWTFNHDVVIAVASKARECANQVRAVLNFSINDKVSDIQIVHQLLSQLGIKTVSRQTRSHPGCEGERIRVYRLDKDYWDKLTAILERRQQRRESLKAADTPQPSMDTEGGACQSPGRKNSPFQRAKAGKYHPPDLWPEAG